jgi:AcrR family transcriptional regulator
MTQPNHTQEMRDAILDAAMRAFNEQGYARATMDSVAREAGVSKGTIYNYFESKRDVFVQILDRISRHDEHGLQEMLVRSGSARERLEMLLSQWTERLPAYEEIGRLFLEFWAAAARDEREGPIKQHLHHLRDRWVSALAGLIREGTRDGSFLASLNPEMAAQLILSTYDGLSLQNILRLTDTDLTALADAMKNAILRSLGCRPSDAPAGGASEESTDHE